MAETSCLLNSRAVYSRTEGSNPSLSAKSSKILSSEFREGFEARERPVLPATFGSR